MEPSGSCRTADVEDALVGRQRQTEYYPGRIKGYASTLALGGTQSSRFDSYRQAEEILVPQQQTDILLHSMSSVAGMWIGKGRIHMAPLELVKLTALMERTSGNPGVKIGLIDGPVVLQHADLATANIREISATNRAMCAQANSTACMHGTFIAGMLLGKRNSPAPAICPNCTLLIHPIFAEPTSGRDHMPSATPLELAAAIIECINAGARVINLSLALAHPSTKGEQALEESLHEAVRREVIIIAAAGNQGTVGSSNITRHPWVIPVVSCDLSGRPLNESNLGSSIGRRGLSAPGDSITSLGPAGRLLTLGGTSVAVPFVTGTAALLWSEFPRATAAQIKLAITHSTTVRKASVVPSLLDATAAYQILLTETAVREQYEKRRQK
jgi:subtilisin family serine protease